MPAFAVSILPMILKYGLPIGKAGFDFMQDVISHRNNNPDQTQEEFEADWVKMQEPYRAAGDAWEDAGNSPDAKA